MSLAAVAGSDFSRAFLNQIELGRAQPSTQNRRIIRRRLQRLPRGLRPGETNDENGNPVKLGWLTLPSFYADMDRHSKSTTRDVLALLKRLKKENIAGLIVDLRRNGGGSLEEAIGTTHLFLKSCPVVQTKGSNEYVCVSREPNPGLDYGGPLIVLTSRQSASASEIFAAALQDAQVGTLVGSKTAGNVGVATQITMPDESVLQVTEQRFVSPLGQQIDGVGVTPDVVVDMSDEDLQNDRDPQLGKALELIVQKITAAGGARARAVGDATQALQLTIGPRGQVTDAKLFGANGSLTSEVGASFGGLDLKLTFAHVFQELGGPDDHVDEGPHEGQDQCGDRRRADDPGIRDAPARVGPAPVDDGQPDDDQEQNQQVDGKIDPAVGDAEDGWREH